MRDEYGVLRIVFISPLRRLWGSGRRKKCQAATIDEEPSIITAYD